MADLGLRLAPTGFDASTTMPGRHSLAVLVDDLADDQMCLLDGGFGSLLGQSDHRRHRIALRSERDRRLQPGAFLDLGAGPRIGRDHHALRDGLAVLVLEVDVQSRLGGHLLGLGLAERAQGRGAGEPSGGQVPPGQCGGRGKQQDQQKGQPAAPPLLRLTRAMGGLPVGRGVRDRTGSRGWRGVEDGGWRVRRGRRTDDAGRGHGTRNVRRRWVVRCGRGRYELGLLVVGPVAAGAAPTVSRPASPPPGPR